MSDGTGPECPTEGCGCEARRIERRAATVIVCAACGEVVEVVQPRPGPDVMG